MTTVPTRATSSVPRALPARPGRLGPLRRTGAHRAPSRMERGLLVTAICLMPFDRAIGVPGGLGVVGVVLAVLAAVVVLRDPGNALRVALDPRALPVYGFLALTLAVEMLHPASSVAWWFRVALNLGALLVVAACCRDRRTLTAALWAMVAVAAVFALPYLMGAYGTVGGSDASSFEESSELRSEVVSDTAWFDFGVNLWSVLLGQAAGLAVALAPLARRQVRPLLYALAVLLALTTILSFSRTGALVVVVSLVVAVVASRARATGKVVRIALVAAAVLVLVPAAVLPRLSVATSDEEKDSRVVIAETVADTAPQWALIGVGAGNYWGGWAEANGFPVKTSVSGTHNAYAQVAVQWGLPGLGLLLLMLTVVARQIPRRASADPLRAALVVLFVSLCVGMVFSHSLYHKHIAVGFGLILAYGIWVRHDGVAGRAR